MVDKLLKGGWVKPNRNEFSKTSRWTLDRKRKNVMIEITCTKQYLMGLPSNWERKHYQKDAIASIKCFYASCTLACDRW